MNADDELALLRHRYTESVPLRLGELDRAVSAWERDTSDGGRLEAAKDIAHRLRGTTGSYGLAHVSEALGRIEDELDRAARSGTSPALERALAEVRARAADAIAALRHSAGAS